VTSTVKGSIPIQQVAVAVATALQNVWFIKVISKVFHSQHEIGGRLGNDLQVWPLLSVTFEPQPGFTVAVQESWPSIHISCTRSVYTQVSLVLSRVNIQLLLRVSPRSTVAATFETKRPTARATMEVICMEGNLKLGMIKTEDC
jgi:hypothetical protein